MLFVLNCLFIFTLTFVVYQDFKNREVTVALFILLGFIGGYLHFTTQYLNVFLLSLLINFTAILLLVFILLIYCKLIMRIKLKEAIGVGDILFFMVLGVSFPTVSFLMLFSISLIFSLLLFIVLKPKMKIKTVPLAGLQALFLALMITINSLFNFINLYAI